MGCMIARMKHYPYTCNPQDVLKAQQEDQMNLMYTDVQVRGISNFYKQFLTDNGIELDIQDNDLDIIKQHTVDYLSFSYYMSMLSSVAPEGQTTQGNLMNSLKTLT